MGNIAGTARMGDAPNFYVMTLNHACGDGAGGGGECASVHDAIRMTPFKRDYSAIIGRGGFGLDLPDADEEYIFR